jgi:hypothetical protein
METWLNLYSSIHQMHLFFWRVGGGRIIVYILLCTVSQDGKCDKFQTLVKFLYYSYFFLQIGFKYLYPGNLTVTLMIILSGQNPRDLPHLGAPPSRTICLESYIFCSLPHVWFSCLADVLFWWRSKL